MNTTRKTIITIFAILAVVLAIRCWFSLHSQPQLKPSDEVYNTVDALFTAITAHDQARLTMCEQRLTQYESAGQIPAAAAKRLTTVINSARAGQWDSAAQSLYEFIQAQRRELSATPNAPARTADTGRFVR
ncbi:MAG TPA: hypothetical protein VGI40_08870 [Pirellulaceae bacterium]|jgi:hypothetical protein